MFFWYLLTGVIMDKGLLNGLLLLSEEQSWKLA